MVQKQNKRLVYTFQYLWKRSCAQIIDFVLFPCCQISTFGTKNLNDIKPHVIFLAYFDTEWWSCSGILMARMPLCSGDNIKGKRQMLVCIETHVFHIWFLKAYERNLKTLRCQISWWAFSGTLFVFLWLNVMIIGRHNTRTTFDLIM